MGYSRKIITDIYIATVVQTNSRWLMMLLRMLVRNDTGFVHINRSCCIGLNIIATARDIKDISLSQRID